MSDKIRVKDLAANLNMSTSDVLKVIRELSIQARASNSVLAQEEIERIKDRIKDRQSAESKGDRREGSDVIIRRRRKSDPAESQAGEGEDNAEAPDLAARERRAETPDADEPADAAQPGPESQAAQDADERESAAVEVTEKKTRKKAPAVSAPARIVSRPEKENAASAQPDEEAAPAAKPETLAGQSEEQAQESKAEMSAQAVSMPEEAEDQDLPASEARAEVSAKGEAQKAKPVRTEKEPQKPSGGVRVISRPDASAPGLGRREVRPARPDQRGEARPDARTDGRPARPGQGQDFRPRPARPGEARPDSRPDQRPDSARPGSGMRAGAFAAPAAPGAGEGDSRGKKRQKGKRTVEFGESADRRFSGKDADGGWMRPGKRGKGRKGKPEVKAPSLPLKAAKRKIRMEEFIRVSDLAHQMGLKAGEVIKVLFALGVMATINQSLDVDTATLVAAEFGYEIEKVGFSEEDVLAAQQEADDPEKMLTRPPVVTIMGHVDHGKTSLLDAIRKTSVTSGEAGGITQHIGAYHVHSKKGDIVFLDTPGHEAFTAMRARGAEVTDIVVLVVAADDGVMEQTREAINHAKAAGVPIMVAVNKMDKEAANPDRVKRELADVGMVPEEWGGDVTFSYMSAKTREGLDDFLELLAIQAEILELKANPDKLARGHIVEAKLDKGRGALGTVLIQEGTLHVGDAFVCGTHHGRVRAMFDDQGRKVTEAGPSMPVEVQGFEGVPEAGEEFVSLADEKTARRIAEARALKQRERELAKESKITLETFLSRRADQEEALVLNLVVKADVQGSLEAVVDQLKKLSTEKVRLNVVHGGAGAISESDVLLAAASDAIIIGFNVRPNPKTKDLAEQEKVDIRFYDIIYKLVEEVRSAMEGLLAPVEKEVVLGNAEVRETFSVPKVGIIAGCHVSDGKIVRNASVRLLRDGVVVFTGRINSLRRFKDDVREVVKGYECGIGIENFNDIKQGDVIEAFEIVEEAAKL